MINREKVIKGLSHCLSVPNREDMSCDTCPYYRCYDSVPLSTKLVEDIRFLLREQEPILLANPHKPYGISTNANSPWISRCPKCGKKVEGRQTRFCKYCGHAVKWE